MKKQVLLFTAIFLSAFSFAQVPLRISIANGSWNNPATWSPAGVPSPADDSIVINTAVTYNQNIVDGQAMFRVNAGASLIDLGNDTATFGGDRLVIDGYFSCDVLAVGMNDSANVHGIVYVATDFGQSGTFIVNPGGQVCVGQQFATSDNVINNGGSISVNNWLNGAAVTGNTGKFCVANYFINTDNISGTVDICDATPNTPFDVNSGTIAGTVTYCALGPCGSCPMPNGISDLSLHGIALEIFPNPFSNSFQLNINPALLNPGLDLEFAMYDMTGREVRKEKIHTASIIIDRGDLPAGIYFYRLMLNGNEAESGKIIAE